MAESIREINNIESKVPGEQKLREAGSEVGDNATQETKTPEQNLAQDNLEKTSDEEIALATKDDFTYSPVITVTKEEATFTKGDLKLQKVIVSEDISDDTTTIKKTLSVSEARGPNESHTEIRSNVQSFSINTSANHDKEIIEDGEKKSFKTTSKIPKLKFKQAIERIKRQQRMIDNNASLESAPEQTLVRSAIPRLKDTKYHTQEMQKDKKQQEIESPRLDEEFDKLYEEILEKEASNDIPSPEKISDPIKLESKFEEIIHAYDEVNVQTQRIDKVKSKIPLLKRKSEPEIEIPPPTYRRNLLKKSNSYDLKDKIPTVITKEKSLIPDVKSIKHTYHSKNNEQAIATSSETKSKTLSANVFESFESTTTIKTMTTQKSSEIIELINISSMENNSLEQMENIKILTSNKTNKFKMPSGINLEPNKESDIISTTAFNNLPRINPIQMTSITSRQISTEQVQTNNITVGKVEEMNDPSVNLYPVEPLSKNDESSVSNTNGVSYKLTEAQIEPVPQADSKISYQTNEVIKVEESSKIKDDIRTIESKSNNEVNNISINEFNVSTDSTHSLGEMSTTIDNKEYLDVSDIKSITFDVIKRLKTKTKTNNLTANETFDENSLEIVEILLSPKIDEEIPKISYQKDKYETKNITSGDDSHNIINDPSKVVTVDKLETEQSKSLLEGDHKILSQTNEASKDEQFSNVKDFVILDSETISNENIAVKSEVEMGSTLKNNPFNQMSSKTEKSQYLDFSEGKSIIANEIKNLKTKEETVFRFVDPQKERQFKSITKSDCSYSNKNLQNSANESCHLSIEKTTVNITKVDPNELRMSQNEKTTEISDRWNNKQDLTDFVSQASTGITTNEKKGHTYPTQNIINKIKIHDEHYRIDQEKLNSEKCNIDHVSHIASLNSTAIDSTNEYDAVDQSTIIERNVKNTIASINTKLEVLRNEEMSKQQTFNEKEEHSVSRSETKNMYVKDHFTSNDKMSENSQINLEDLVRNNIIQKEETLNETNQSQESLLSHIDELDEEDIIILKGKVSRIKRRLDSKEFKTSRKEIDDVPKEVSVISKIAMFEHNESLNTVAHKKENTMDPSVEISNKPKVVQEILKTSTNTLDTNNNENNLTKETIVQNTLKHYYNKDNKLYNPVKTVEQETKFDTYEEHSNTISKQYFDIVKVSKTENQLTDISNYKEKIVWSKFEDNNEVFMKKKGETSSLDIWHQYKTRKEIDSDARRAKSLAELDVGDAMKGRVKQMVVRLNSIERMSMSRKEIIDLREKPRMGSVSKRIALFERKLVPIRGEDDHIPRSSSKPSSDIAESVNEEELKKKVEELTNVKMKYRTTDMTYMELSDGSQMPVLAVGTAMLEPKLLKHIVHAAIDLGYRGFDTAYIYGNERELGSAIRDKIQDGTVKREDLYIISKLWSTFHRRDLVEKACRNSLQEMGLDYFDLYLIHNPMSLKEGPNPLPKIANVLQYSEHDYMDAWFGIEAVIRKGLVKRGGVSNFNSVQVERIIEKGKIKPVINQVECHPYLSQCRLDDFCGARNIKLSCYSVLGSSGTPPQWKSTLPAVLEDPLVRVMAAGLGVTPGQLLISYQLQLGHHVVVKSSSGKHLWDNLQALAVRLDPSQVAALNALNKNKRAFAFKGMGDTHKNYPFKIAF